MRGASPFSAGFPIMRASAVRARQGLPHEAARARSTWEGVTRAHAAARARSTWDGGSEGAQGLPRAAALAYCVWKPPRRGDGAPSCARLSGSSFSGGRRGRGRGRRAGGGDCQFRLRRAARELRFRPFCARPAQRPAPWVRAAPSCRAVSLSGHGPMDAGWARLFRRTRGRAVRVLNYLSGGALRARNERRRPLAALKRVVPVRLFFPGGRIPEGAAKAMRFFHVPANRSTNGYPFSGASREELLSPQCNFGRTPTGSLRPSRAFGRNDDRRRGGGSRIRARAGLPASRRDVPRGASLASRTFGIAAPRGRCNGFPAGIPPSQLH